jgi:hypothetical protein
LHGVLAGVVLAVAMAAAEGAELARAHLERDDWPAQRDHRSILSLTAVRTVLEAYDETRDRRLLIRYPGGDLGNAWAFELRDWMVALGVPSASITLLPGSGAPDRLVLSVEPAH